MIPALIPLLTCVTGGLVLFLRARQALTLRESFLISVTLAAGWLVLGIELLSLFQAIHFWPVLWWWLAPCLVLVGLLAHDLRAAEGPLFSWPQSSAFDRCLLLMIVFLLGWSWCQAWFSPPNNVDSNEYHLQRQVYWLQQQSVENYPATNLRQLAMPPLTEFAGLTLMVLSGNDRYHNLVQWFALILSMSAVSLTTRMFNRSPTAQLLAAVWVLTIPLAFLQASTTKNDVVVLMWTCLLVYWVLQLSAASRPQWSRLALIGLAFGAAALTKGTGVIFTLPLAALAGYYLVRYHLRQAAPALVLIAAAALSLNLGHFARTYHTFGSLAPDQPGIHDGPPVGNEDYSPLALISNMVRNIGPHFVTPIQPLNDRLAQLMLDFHAQIGRDMNDPRSTWMPGGRFRPYQFWQDDEDKAATPAHMLLLVLMPAVMLWTRRELPWRVIVAVLFVFFVGFFLFSAVLKWQNWNVRLVITLPAVLAPVFAWTYGAVRMRYVVLLPVILLVGTLTASLNSLQRPLLGSGNIFTADPLALRYYYHADWPAEYRRLVKRIEELEPHTVGFFTGAGFPDYPMQRLLLDAQDPPPRIMTFNAKLQIAGTTEPDPDVLIVARSNAKRLKHASSGTWYAAQEKFGPYTLFLREQ